MQIGFFGNISEQIGRVIEVDAGGASTVAALRRILAAAFPAAADQIMSSGLKACIDDRVVDDKTVLGEAQRVEFFPPLSGG